MLWFKIVSLTVSFVCCWLWLRLNLLLNLQNLVLRDSMGVQEIQHQLQVPNGECACVSQHSSLQSEVHIFNPTHLLSQVMKHEEI